MKFTLDKRSLHNRRKKQRRYILLAAVLMSFLMCSMISMGGPERFFRRVSVQLLGGIRESKDTSADIIPTIDMEEKAYLKIKEQFGFTPIRVGYLPEDTYFKEYYVMEELPAINMLYECNGKAKVIYWMTLNYRGNSFVNFIDDELLEEFFVDKSDKVTINVVKYQVKEDHTIRWIVRYKYQDVYYSINIIDVQKEEVEKIVNDLYFP